jgi:ADP-ribose pyrophosphatase YjhB (NUDIX family)
MHRARAVGIVVDGDRILATRVSQPMLGEHPHWLWPGGRVEGDESLEECAVREVKEETGLEVRANRLIYVYQSVDDINGLQNAEFFFLCDIVGGQLGSWELDVEAKETILDTRFIARDDLDGEDVWPQKATDRIWDDLAAGFPSIVDLGFRHITQADR